MKKKIKQVLEKEKATKQDRIWLRIASACNNNCIFCLDSQSQNGSFQKIEEVKRKIKEGYKKNCENRIILSGGEASINPFFSEYIKYAKDIGYNRVQTITNGIMFSSEDFCKKTIEAGLEEITFSFHGHNETLHDYLVSTPGAFKKSLKGLIFIKKNYPQIVVNIDIVVNKVNVKFLPQIVKFFIKFGVYEFDILQIIPFGRAFGENRDKLFYDIEENISFLHKTWELSKISGMYMWSNRFPAEAFEGYEDLIQDPRKIKSEVMGEGVKEFKKFITSHGKKIPHCFGDACQYCFQNQYCHNLLKYQGKRVFSSLEKYSFIDSNNGEIPDGEYIILRGKNFLSEIYLNFGEEKNQFISFLSYLENSGKKIINIPKCLFGSGIYETYEDMEGDYTLEDYTEKYIFNLYRKKSLSCKKCKYFHTCEGIHINFIKAYGFAILKPILK